MSNVKPGRFCPNGPGSANENRGAKGVGCVRYDETWKSFKSIIEDSKGDICVWLRSEGPIPLVITYPPTMKRICSPVLVGWDVVRLVFETEGAILVAICVAAHYGSEESVTGCRVHWILYWVIVTKRYLDPCPSDQAPIER